MRSLIIELYVAKGTPPSLAEIAKKAGISTIDVEKRLNQEPKLRKIGNIRIRQASELIEYYGKGTLFEDDVEDRVEEFMRVNKKIKERENKISRGQTEPPPV